MPHLTIDANRIRISRYAEESMCEILGGWASHTLRRWDGAMPPRQGQDGIVLIGERYRYGNDRGIPGKEIDFPALLDAFKPRVSIVGTIRQLTFGGGLQ